MSNLVPRASLLAGIRPVAINTSANGNSEFSDILELRFLMLLVLIKKLSETPQGVQVLQALFKTLGDALDALGRASAANPVTAWANPFLVGCVLEQFGFISRNSMIQFKTGLSLISGAKVIEGFVDDIAKILPFTPHDPSDFPQTVDLGDRVESALGQLEQIEK